MNDVIITSIPDWANFRLLGEFFIREQIVLKCGYFLHRKSRVLNLTKDGLHFKQVWAGHWAILSPKKSGHPGF
jgi:hypothetical protein